ncbi:MAG: redoxin domain-containing protein [Dehalococcoidia bacterium]|nr:redoxin domain-containing protein [Dehalococcoidia bacterium]
MRKKSIIILISLMALALWLSSCSYGSGVTLPWRDVELTDVRTEETFKISKFAGKPVVIEMMTTTCHICEDQMKQIAKAYEQAGEDVVFISLNLDSSVSDEALREHMESMGFDWFAATLSRDQVRSLEAEFGPHIVNLAASPVIILDPWQDAHMLKPGMKTADQLLDQIAEIGGL